MSKPHTQGRLGLLQLLRGTAASCVIVLMACSNSDPLDSGSEVLEIKPSVGGQSGVSGSCWPGPPWRDIDKDAVRALAAGHHETSFRWSPWWEPSASSADDELTIDVVPRDREARLAYTPGEDCGFEAIQAADVTLRTRAQPDATRVTFPATITASERANALLFVDFESQQLLPTKLQRLLPPAAASDPDSATAMLRLGISERGVNGSIALREGGYDCRVARIGGPCKPDEQEAELDSHFGDITAADVVAALKSDASRELTRSNGARAQISVEARLLDQPLCTHPLGYQEQTRYTGKPAGDIEFGASGTVVVVPMEVRITAGDDMFDIWIPVNVETMIVESRAWNGRILYFGAAVVPATSASKLPQTISHEIANTELLMLTFDGNNVGGESQAWESLKFDRIRPDAKWPMIDSVLDARGLGTSCFARDETREAIEHFEAQELSE